MHTQISKMLQTHPQPQTTFDPAALAECLEACLECSARSEEHTSELQSPMYPRMPSSA